MNIRPLLFPVPALFSLLVALWLSGMACQALAANDGAPLQAFNSSQPWRIKADRMSFNGDQGIVVASGNTVLRQQGITIEADRIRYNREASKLHLWGNVRIRRDKDSASAEEARINLDKETGWIRDGSVFLSEPHLYLTGHRLNKTGPNTYTFQQATLTSCDGQRPDWSLKSSQGSVTLEGYAWLWHPRFRIKDAPMLYSPFMILPAKRERQSGFLLPEFTTSTRDGFGVSLPYFQVINQEQDVTLFLHSMSRRGVMTGAEYRLTPNLNSQGLFRADWLEDQLDSEEIEQYDNYERPSSSRFWLRGKFDGDLGTHAWRGKLDLDFASDPFYLREFDSGYQGFDRSRSLFLERFGRDIADQDNPIRENVATLSRNWANVGLQTRVEYNQNLNYFRSNPEDDPTLQRLPQIDLNLYQQPLLDTPLEWEADNEATYFWRREGYTGTRLDVHPRLSLPVNTIYGSLQPSLGWRQTLYYTENRKETSPTDRFEQRGIWDFTSSASTEFMRIFQLNPVRDLKAKEGDLGSTQWSKIKHSLSPQLDYIFVPEKDQSHLPHYDSVDRIKQKNEITYSISNLFTLREDSIRAVPEQNRTSYQRDTKYRDLLRLDLEQSYDIKEANRDRDLDTYPKRPFSDIRMEMELTPFPWLSYTDTTWYSIYINDITEHQHRLDLTPGDTFSTYFAYDYLRQMQEDIHRRGQDKLSIARAGASLNPDSGWNLQYDMERDLQTSRFIKQEASLGYTHQCWKLALHFTKQPDETSVAVTIGLRPFGELQQGLLTRQRE